MKGYSIRLESEPYEIFTELCIEHDGDFYKISEDDFSFIYDADSDENKLVIRI